MNVNGTTVVQPGQPFPEEWKRSVFIYTTKEATPNILGAVDALNTVIFNPNRNEEQQSDNAKALEWTQQALNFSDIILFWFPSHTGTAEIASAAATFGRWASSGKVVYGHASPSTEGTSPAVTAVAHVLGRMDLLANQEKVTIHPAIEDAVADIENRFKSTSEIRRGGERGVPLHVWQHKAFKNWYGAQRAVGNRLDGCIFEWAFRVGPRKQFLLYWVLHVDVHVLAENRNKSNEIVLARTDIKSVCPYYVPPGAQGPEDCEVVLIKEFRSPAKTDDCFIHELPGGSAFKAQEPVVEAASELHEEVGLEIRDLSRFVDHGPRQLAGTTSAHRAYLFSVQLTGEEAAHCRRLARAGRALGEAGETERTYVEVHRLGDLLAGGLVDWATLGMVSTVLRQAPALRAAGAGAGRQQQRRERPGVGAGRPGAAGNPKK